MSIYPFGMQMAKIRKQRGLTQSELADIVGVEQPTISRMEREDEGATLRQYKAVAKVLEVSLSELFADERELAEQAILSAFRSLDDGRKAGWMDLAQAFSSQKQ